MEEIIKGTHITLVVGHEVDLIIEIVSKLVKNKIPLMKMVMFPGVGCVALSFIGTRIVRININQNTQILMKVLKKRSIYD